MTVECADCEQRWTVTCTCKSSRCDCGYRALIQHIGDCDA